MECFIGSPLWLANRQTDGRTTSRQSNSEKQLLQACEMIALSPFAMAIYHSRSLLFVHSAFVAVAPAQFFFCISHIIT